MGIVADTKRARFGERIDSNVTWTSYFKDFVYDTKAREIGRNHHWDMISVLQILSPMSKCVLTIFDIRQIIIMLIGPNTKDVGSINVESILAYCNR